MTSTIPAPDEYWHELEPHLRCFLPEDRQVAVTLYRELAKGKAVSAEQLAQALGVSPAEGRARLQRASIKCLVYPNGEGHVLGFGGLAAAPMHHRFEIEGQTLFTWCAWDSLFIPEILGRSARVTSCDPESGETVRLVVTPARIEAAEPAEAVVSFVQPQAQVFGTTAANVMAKFCHYVFFFASRQSGERWIAKNPDTFLYSLDDAFALAKRLNAKNFGPELAPRTLRQRRSA
jgi:alkylmercury lyase